MEEEEQQEAILTSKPTGVNNNIGIVDVEEEEVEGGADPPPLAMARTPSLTSVPLAMVGVKLSHIESLDYEINENDLLKQDWRSRSTAQVLQYIFLKWFLAFLIGLLTGTAASLVNLGIENIAGYKMLMMWRLVQEERYLTGFAFYAGANFLLVLFAATLVVNFAPTAAGPGIPEIKAYLNGVDTPDMFGASTLIVKILGSIGAVSAGLNLGKEGPMVHIGACFASLLGQGGPAKRRRRCRWRWLRHFENDRDRRDLITCGASSGVCAAFRAPIGGVLFSMEEVASWWRGALLWRTFFSTAMVLVVLRGFIELCSTKGRCGLFGRGGLIIFDLSGVTVRYNAVDIFFVVLTGVVGGVLGSLFNYLLHKVLRVYAVINRKGKLAKLALSLAVSLFTSVCLYTLPFLVSCSPCDPDAAAECPISGSPGNFKQFNCPVGYYNDLASLLHATNDDAVRNIFSPSTSAEFRPISLIIFFLLYCVLSLLTFGIAVPSGLFLPIILMGSGYGRLIGLAALPYAVEVDQGLYAVLGAAALMAGSMRMTVSVCVIFLELTSNFSILPVTMLVLLIAKTTGDSINPSIYEIILELKGLPFLGQVPKLWMSDITVGELAAAKPLPAIVCLRRVEKVSRVVEVLCSTGHNGFPVVGEEELQGLVLRSHLVGLLREKRFLVSPAPAVWPERKGKVGMEEVELAAGEMEMYVDLSSVTNATPYTVVESMSLANALVLFRKVGLRHLLILPKYRGPMVPPVIGILTRQDLMASNILNAFPHLVERTQEKQNKL